MLLNIYILFVCLQYLSLQDLISHKLYYLNNTVQHLHNTYSPAFLKKKKVGVNQDLGIKAKPFFKSFLTMWMKSHAWLSFFLSLSHSQTPPCFVLQQYTSHFICSPPVCRIKTQLLELVARASLTRNFVDILTSKRE